MQQIVIPRPTWHVSPHGQACGKDVWTGRLRSVDLKDSNYMYKDIKPQLGPPKSAASPSANEKYWNENPFLPLDQGYTPRCVGYSLATILVTGPITQPSLKTLADAQAMADRIYLDAIQNDEWPGADPNFGTSVRAGLEAGRKFGYIGSYIWMNSLQDAVDFVMKYGPIQMGTIWLDSMMQPDKKGYLVVDKKELTNPKELEGHAWAITGVSKKLRRFRGTQTWGDQWGIEQTGHFYISFDDWEVVHYNDGEAAGITEKKVLPAKIAA